VPNKEATAYVLTRLAESWLLQGDYPQTLALAERAYTLAKEVDGFSTSWYARMASGKAQRALDQPAQASQTFTEAVAIIESLRSQPAAVELGDGRSGVLPYLSQVELLIGKTKLLKLSTSPNGPKCRRFVICSGELPGKSLKKCRRRSYRRNAS
jgi:hypothetical protein